MKKKSSREKLFVSLVFLLLSFFVTFSHSQAEPPYLFEIKKQETSLMAQLESERTPKRIVVSANIHLLKPGAISSTEFTIITPDKRLIAQEKRLEERSKDSWTWFGKVKEDELSSVVLTVVDGVLNGKVVTQNGTYAIEPYGSNYVVIKEDKSLEIHSEDDYLIPKIEEISKFLEATSEYSESGDVIDVLVLYTQQFATKYGSQLSSKIQHAIDLASEAFRNSGINTRFRLVRSELFTDSQASEGVSAYNALSYITGSQGYCSSSNLPSPPSTIRSLRDRYGADIVALFRVYNGGSLCGVGWILNGEHFCNPYFAFAVVEFKSASEGGYYCPDTTFAHESGHLLGGDHDRRTGCDSGFFSYSCGYGVDYKFVTIMAYASSFVGASYILHYSNPNVTYNGIPTGVSYTAPNGADNAKTFNYTRKIVANYRVISNDACTYSISPSSQSFASSGGSGSVYVTASSSSCSWTAQSNNSWITITSGSEGIGSGTVNYYVYPNTSSISRTGTLTIAGKTFTVIQSGTSSGNPLTDPVAFVRQQYLDFLGREPDDGGLAYWAEQINSGRMTRAQVIDAFMRSDEFGKTIAPIIRLYFAYFLRIPDYDGLLYWINAYKIGENLTNISESFASSQEFQNRYGNLTNEQFVTLLYWNVLERAPDSGGFVYWTNQLNSGRMTRGEVMLGFSESQEYKNKIANSVYVTMAYVGMLRRAPDQEGFNYWLGLMNSEQSELSLIEGFLYSEEYANRFK